jgi:hypothetical protein
MGDARAKRGVVIPSGNGRARRAPAGLAGLALGAAWAAVGLAPRAVGAQEFSPLRETQVKVTETAIFNYHFDNRDNIRENDKYGEWLNRLNVQANNGPLTLQIRLDSAVYQFKPDPNRLAEADAAEPIERGPPRPPTFIEDKTFEHGRNLSVRYINTVYLSKLALSYTRSGLDLTVGDFYAQLGRGMVLAMRKADELAADSTIRGGKVVYRPDLGKMRLNATALAGLTNPLRVDEVSGRQLWQGPGRGGSVVFPGAPTPRSTVYLADPQPNFAPDLIAGGRVEGGTKHVLVGAQEIVMTRGDAPFYAKGGEAQVTRRVSRVSIGSISASVPNIAEHGNLYFEAAFQTLSNPYLPEEAESVTRLSGGKALYAQTTAFAGPFTLSVEGKHYDRFFPLMATIANGTSEFAGLQYNAVPTTELITSDTQFDSFNTCVTGGRARLDFRASSHALAYGSVGRYATWGEQSSTCGVEPRGDEPSGKNKYIRNDVWDPIVGIEINFEDNRTHLYASTGVRADDSAVPVSYDTADRPPSTLYYREHWVRYDGVKKIYGPLSLQMAGFHRYRFYPLQAEAPWREGENYVSLIYSPKASVAFGYEYTTKGGERTDYYNGQVQYRFTTDTVARFFVGQTRPALRCVSGVCRQFPAFEGAKLEAVVRF